MTGFTAATVRNQKTVESLPRPESTPFCFVNEREEDQEKLLCHTFVNK